MLQHITLVIPGLYLFDQQQMKQEYPALFSLAKSTKWEDCPYSYHQLLTQLLQCPLLEYQAPLLALADQLPVQEKEWWMRVEPVQIATDQNGAYLLGNKHLNLTEVNASGMRNKLNQFLKQDGLELLATDPMNWYLRLSEKPGITTKPFTAVLTKNIYHFLPEGPRQDYWRRLMTEMQMLLHQFAKDEATSSCEFVNSVWFWGEGQLSAMMPEVFWDSVCSDDLLVQGLARWLGLKLKPTTLSFEEYSQGLTTGKHLWVIHELMMADFYLDEKHEKDVLQRLEKNLFTPLLAALKHKQVARVDIYFPTDCLLPISSTSFIPWWRGGGFL